MLLDVSKVGCHCNSAAYFVKMPGYNFDQKPDPGEEGDYYCGANYGNGIWCPEYDTWEGNMYTMASALHICSGIPPSYYYDCDRAGCNTNAYNVDPTMMCPKGLYLSFSIPCTFI